MPGDLAPPSGAGMQNRARRKSPYRVSAFRGHPENLRTGRAKSRPAIALGCQIMARSIGAPDNRRHPVERRYPNVVSTQYRVERTSFSFVSELDAIDVVGSCA